MLPAEKTMQFYSKIHTFKVKKNDLSTVGFENHIAPCVKPELSRENN